jgi:hypothetical protein
VWQALDGALSSASAAARPTYLWEGIIDMLIEFSVANFCSILSRADGGDEPESFPKS